MVTHRTHIPVFKRTADAAIISQYQIMASLLAKWRPEKHEAIDPSRIDRFASYASERLSSQCALADALIDFFAVRVLGVDLTIFFVVAGFFAESLELLAFFDA